MKTGLYFGSFNPVHNGHLMLANFLTEYSALDCLWFVVSPQNPFKQKESLLPDYHRLELLKRAIEGYKKFWACDVEFRMPKPSYTIDTLTYLKEKYPDREFYLIMGTDNLERLDRWKNYEQILQYHNVLVFPRNGSSGGQLVNHPKVTLVETPIIEISSTFIRQSVHNGKDVRFFMPEKAFEYLDEMNFYKK
ncbi:MAG: nicotinate-nucleotide adenylyltransferase [Bacteroidales bacterium]|nr:nicotinate-nucleotide adenylyltransferase [Bacteroidales bacterium]